MRRDPGQQLLHRERLRHVVVGAQIEAEKLVALLDASRQHQDRDPPRLLPLAELPTDRQAVHVGQVQVEEDEVGRAGEKGVEGDEAARVPLHLVTAVPPEVVRQA